MDFNLLVHILSTNDFREGIIYPSDPKIIVKSRTGHPVGPTQSEMELQIESGLPMFLVIKNSDNGRIRVIHFGDHLLDEPVIGLPYVYGVTDCYSCIRRWFWQNRQNRLPDFARTDHWWTTDNEMYRNGYQIAGFQQIEINSLSDIKEGDCFLGPAANGQREQHGGVFLGNGTIVHHLAGRRSEISDAKHWFDTATRIVKYIGIKPNS